MSGCGWRPPLASDDDAAIQEAIAALLRPATTALTDSALVALEQAIGISAGWVDREVGADAGDRYLLDLKDELLPPDDTGDSAE